MVTRENPYLGDFIYSVITVEYHSERPAWGSWGTENKDFFHNYCTLGKFNRKINVRDGLGVLCIPVQYIPYKKKISVLIWEALGQSMFVYSSPSPRNVSCGCPHTASPWRHPLAVSLMMFLSQFPTVLKHKQVHSAGLIAAKVSQETGKTKKVWGRTVFGCSPNH